MKQLALIQQRGIVVVSSQVLLWQSSDDDIMLAAKTGDVSTSRRIAQNNTKQMILVNLNRINSL
jgi:hypothetical protein